jgi:hypothetical protein
MNLHEAMRMMLYTGVQARKIIAILTSPIGYLGKISLLWESDKTERYSNTTKSRFAAIDLTEYVRSSEFYRDNFVMH